MARCVLNNIELIIVLLLLFMAVPDACRRVERPALAYPVFVVFGIVLGPFLNPQVTTMLQQAGQVGFLLLLFEVGLEIDLPRLSEFRKPLRFAVTWALIQYPVVLLAAHHAGFDLPQATLAAAGLTGCSVGMAYPAWKSFQLEPPDVRQFVLHGMVALEMLAIVSLAVGTTALQQGLTWLIVLRLLGITLVVVLIARFASHLVELSQKIITMTTHWRTHWLALLILLVCALGDRLGLSAQKTAFFLGLAMSRARHNGMELDVILAPISRRFLIPLFFVSLGSHLKWEMLSGWPALLAVGTAGLLLGVREVMTRRWLKLHACGPVFLLYSPNLTMVALAASALLAYGHYEEEAAWLMVTGLLLTVPSLLLLPRQKTVPE